MKRRVPLPGAFIFAAAFVFFDGIVNQNSILTEKEGAHEAQLMTIGFPRSLTARHACTNIFSVDVLQAL